MERPVDVQRRDHGNWATALGIEPIHNDLIVLVFRLYAFPVLGPTHDLNNQRWLSSCISASMSSTSALQLGQTTTGPLAMSSSGQPEVTLG